MDLPFRRIVQDPSHLGGLARVRGTRIAVDVLAALTADGVGEAEIHEQYPDLTPEDLAEALAFDRAARGQ